MYLHLLPFKELKRLLFFLFKGICKVNTPFLRSLVFFSNVMSVDQQNNNNNNNKNGVPLPRFPPVTSLKARFTEKFPKY